MTKQQLRVERITVDDAKPWILERHYAKRMPCITDAYGAFVGGILSGVCTFGVPASPSLCTGVCGDSYRQYVLELNRLCVMDNAEFNTSEFLGRCLRRLGSVATSGGAYGRIIVSYADTGMGHIGIVYQATNWIYTGVTKERTDIGADDGTHSRHYDKSCDYSTNRKLRTAKHRYVNFVGNRRWCKGARRALRYKEEPYPKGTSARYDTSTPIETQSVLF